MVRGNLKIYRTIADLASESSQIDRIEFQYPTLEEMFFKVGT